MFMVMVTKYFYLTYGDGYYIFLYISIMHASLLFMVPCFISIYKKFPSRIMVHFLLKWFIWILMVMQAKEKIGNYPNIFPNVARCILCFNYSRDSTLCFSFFQTMHYMHFKILGWKRNSFLHSKSNYDLLPVSTSSLN